MSKNVILIMDKHKAFKEGFKRFIESQTDDDVYLIESIDERHQYHYDYFLLDSEMAKAIEYIDHRIFLIVNSDDECQAYERKVNRYQKANVILRQLRDQGRNFDSGLFSVAVASMSGGSGKTAVTNGLAMAMDGLGQKSLVLSFSPYCQALPLDIDLSLLIYYFSHSQPVPELLKEKILEVLQRPTGVVYGRLNTPEDSNFITLEALKQLYCYVEELCHERVIISEAPWAYGPRLESILTNSTYKLIIGDQRHSRECIKEWVNRYQKSIEYEKGFYQLKNRSKTGGRSEEIYEISMFQEDQLEKGMKEWAQKYLLTHWMKR